MRLLVANLRLTLVPILLLVLAHPSLAQVDGKVVGTITDRDTGLPLAGVVVTIAGTSLGNVSDKDGTYFVNRVPVGVRQVAVEFLGYRPQSRELRILAGQTATTDFALDRSPIETAEVVAVIEREPLLVRDETGSKTHFTGEDAVRLPIESVRELVALSTGIYPGQEGFIIRGGRGSESATYVDGVLVSEFTAQRDFTEVGPFAVEEIDVITGGFGAEFGHAQSGLVNIVTRSAGTEFHGNVRFTTDGRFGTDGIDVEEGRILASEPCCGYNSLQVALGGPLVSRRLTLFGSLEATGAADIDPKAGGFNASLGELNSHGSTRGILPGSRGDRTRLHLKTTAFLPDVGSLSGTLLFSRDQEERHDQAFGMDQHLSGSALRSKAWDLILSWDRSLFRSADHETTLRVVAHSHRSENHTGVPKSPEAAALLRAQLGEACGNECDVSEDTFGSDFLNFRFNDIQFFFEDSLPGTVPSLRFAHPVGLDPVFGVARVALSDGIHHAFGHSEERRATLRTDLDSQLDRFHRLKVGTEWTWIDIDRDTGWLHEDSFADTYHVDPLVGAAYVQHRWDAGDFVLDVGLRWDHWDPRTRFPTVPGRVPCEIAAERYGCTPGASTAAARRRDALAPRIGMAHPLTDRTQLRLSFGRFYQLPELRHYFLRYNIHAGNTVFGNPQLDYIRTTALEVGATHLISPGTALDVVAYHRDRRGAVRTAWFQFGQVFPEHPEMHVFVNGDHGNVKGVDVTLSRRFPPFVSADLAWSLQAARGTTSSPIEWLQTFGFLREPDNPFILLTPPMELRPDSYDRTHALDARFLLQLPPGFRQGSWLGALENLRAAIVYGARSGTPYTRVNPIDGFPLGELGGARRPWTHEGNLRVVKGLPLGTDASLELFVWVLNVFGTRNVLNVHSLSGLPDQHGFEDDDARNPVIPRDLLSVDAPDGFPVLVDDVRPEYRDMVGRQDLNSDGSITLAEAQESLRRALVAFASDSPYSYGTPRQVRFGVELRF